MDDKEMYESLIKWLKILDLSGACDTSQDLSSGVALGELLALLVPNSEYAPKIKNITNSDNWRLKASNLKKILDCIVLYYSDILDLSLEAHLKPDVMKVAESNDEIELIKLLKLLLGISVNCDQKQKYITQIMEMEEDVQQNIMKALQDIENIGTPSSARNSMNQQNQDLHDDREQLAQKLHEKENLLRMMLEEKNAMQQEIQNLKLTLDKHENRLIGDDGVSLGMPLQGSARMNELRKQVENLKNDLMLSETVKEDLKMKSMQQEKEIASLQIRIDELTKASTELSQIKDEVDILREASDKAKEYERQLQVYKKKLEEFNDLKRQLKHAEDRISEYVTAQRQYEDENRKASTLKGQVELYKGQIEELHMKLESEMQKTVKAEFDVQVLETKLAGVQRERDNLLSQRDILQEKVDELRCNNPNNENDDESANISRELLGDNLKDKIARLEAENQALRDGQGNQQSALSDLLNDSNQRNEKLREQLKAANQKILLLSSQTDDEKGKNDILELRELCDQRERLLEEAQSQISNSHSRIRQLESNLESKNHELGNLELKYKKCVEKAKEVIKGLDPRLLGDQIENATNDVREEEEKMSTLESKLIVKSFYMMAMHNQREAVDSRLASITQGHSFMARQRQPTSRKPVTSFKK
ncbi:hypothetical protein PVAND_011324 [Polypedilum vanderplanki]|uniref:Protein hook n=1 Tax=Polypedilum vanderplanki TaxID=319348 RepID=A0A9J6CI74_POLVA|nr:hypothetical protein PVAND_011324 [Polypedilum vanderplanki]